MFIKDGFYRLTFEVEEVVQAAADDVLMGDNDDDEERSEDEEDDLGDDFADAVNKYSSGNAKEPGLIR